jgi:hypothetical protein
LIEALAAAHGLGMIRLSFSSTLLLPFCMACGGEKYELGSGQAPVEVPTGGMPSFGDDPYADPSFAEGEPLGAVLEWRQDGATPRVAIDASGNAIVAWELSGRVLVVTRQASGGWSGVRSTLDYVESHVGAVAAGGGNFALIGGENYIAQGGSDPYVLVAKYYSAELGWSSLIHLGRQEYPSWHNGGHGDPLAAVSPSGRAWAVWTDAQTYASAFDMTSGWSNHEKIEAGDTALAYPAALSVGADDVLTAAWASDNPAPTSGDKGATSGGSMNVNRFVPDEGWEGASGGSFESYDAPRITPGIDGTMHAAVVDGNALQVRRYDPAQGWLDWERASGVQESGAVGVYTAPDGGRAAFFSASLSPTCEEQLWMTRSAGDGSWSEPELVETGGGFVIGSNPSGKLVIAAYDVEQLDNTCVYRSAWLKRLDGSEREQLGQVDEGYLAGLTLQVGDDGSVLVAWEEAPHGWDSSVVARLFDLPSP